jgi:hypothetical protein
MHGKGRLAKDERPGEDRDRHHTTARPYLIRVPILER